MYTHYTPHRFLHFYTFQEGKKGYTAAAARSICPIPEILMVWGTNESILHYWPVLQSTCLYQSENCEFQFVSFRDFCLYWVRLTVRPLLRLNQNRQSENGAKNLTFVSFYTFNLTKAIFFHVEVWFTTLIHFQYTFGSRGTHEGQGQTLLINTQFYFLRTRLHLMFWCIFLHYKYWY